MHVAHLRLEADRVDWALHNRGGGMDGAVHHRAARAVALDRRLASLHHAPAKGAALLGYVILPWCDVTLWGVMPLAHSGDEASHGLWPGRATCAGACAHAWMRVELEQVDVALAYVERLPVVRGLAAKAWRWRWSSAPWHCGFGSKPAALAPEWGGPLRRDLWRERLAGAFVGRSDRSEPVADTVVDSAGQSPAILGSAVDRLAQRPADHSPGIPSSAGMAVAAMDPSHGELAVA